MLVQPYGDLDAVQHTCMFERLRHHQFAYVVWQFDQERCEQVKVTAVYEYACDF